MSIKRELIASLWKGDNESWRIACEHAKANGWTRDDVMRVFWFYSPSALMLYVLFFGMIGVLFALLLK